MHTHNTAERLGSLEGRVGGLERGLEGLRHDVTSGLQALGQKFDQRTQPPYTLMVSCAGIILTVLALVGTSWKAPIDTALLQHTTDLHRIQADYVPRWVHERVWTSDKAERDRLQKQIDELRRR